MQVNFEQAIEIIKTLPPEDFRRLDEWIEDRKREESQAQVKEQKLKTSLIYQPPNGKLSSTMWCKNGASIPLATASL